MGRKELADYINRRIGEIDITISELSKRSVVPRSEIYKILNCECTPSVDTLKRLSIGLGVHNSTLISKLHKDYIRPRSGVTIIEKYRHYNSGWVRDATYPDNSIVSTNQKFEKIWEIQNVGKEIWDRFCFINVDNPSLPNYLKPERIKYRLPKVLPGETIQIKIKFKAPPYAGSVISRWKIIDSDGHFVFPDKCGIWCQVEVVDM